MFGVICLFHWVFVLFFDVLFAIILRSVYNMLIHDRFDKN